MSITKRVLLLLKMEVRELIKAAIITAIIKPRSPGGAEKGTKIRTRPLASQHCFFIPVSGNCRKIPSYLGWIRAVLSPHEEHGSSPSPQV